MQVFHTLAEVPSSTGPLALAIGNFDGIHLGHRSLLKALLDHCRATGRKPGVLTFHPHPVEVLNPAKKLERLTTTEEKLSVLESLGVECVLVEKFDAALAAIEAQAFFEKYLKHGLRAQAIFVGFNFQFGKARGGDTDLLKTLCAQSGITLHVEPPFAVGGHRISSSAVREALRSGDLAGANRMLGRAFSIRGTVIRGAGKGRTLGFPTANLQYAHRKCLPSNGVYVTRAIWQRQAYPSVTNIGSRPTISPDSQDISVEAHLINFQTGLYEETLELEFLERIRDEKKFGSLDELKAQITRDAQYAAQKFQ